MRYDTIIIGGGLSGLTCGIALAKGGQRVAVIGAGQSTLHFNSGSISLLGYDTEGNTVASPLEAMEQLPATHPYHRVGDKAARAAAAGRGWTEDEGGGQGQPLPLDPHRTDEAGMAHDGRTGDEPGG